MRIKKDDFVLISKEINNETIRILAVADDDQYICLDTYKDEKCIFTCLDKDDEYLKNTTIIPLKDSYILNAIK